MKLVLSLAWRNLGRNKSRSLVVFLSMALGVWAGIFLMGWASGINQARTQSAIQGYLGDGHVNDSGYVQEMAVAAFIPNGDSVADLLRQQPGIAAVSARLSLPTMVQTTSGSAGLQIMGVRPTEEESVFTVKKSITTGAFLADTNRAFMGMVIGDKLAERMDLQLGDPLVITFQDHQGVVHSALYILEGTYDGSSNRIEEATAFVRRDPLADIIQLKGAVHDIVFKTTHPEGLKDSVTQWRAKLFPYSVRTWREVSPDMGYADEVMSQALLLFMLIILLAMAFGILNTMLMAILERRHELGMLMAVGLNKHKLFQLVVVETLLLSGVGLPLGLLLGHVTLEITSRTGISLAAFEQGLAEFGISSVIYPKVVMEWYLPVAAMVFVLSFLAALYPAKKAVSLNPIESMRTL